jgi:hypothetical protein
MASIPSEAAAAFSLVYLPSTVIPLFSNRCHYRAGICPLPISFIILGFSCTSLRVSFGLVSFPLKNGLR